MSNIIDETDKFELKQTVNKITRWLKLAEDKEKEFLENPLPLLKYAMTELDKMKQVINEIHLIIVTPAFYKQTLLDANMPVEMENPFQSSHEKLRKIETLLSTIRLDS